MLKQNGIRIKSSFGDFAIDPNLITKDKLKPIYDIILLTCKSYDLTEVINDLNPVESCSCN